MIDLLVMVCGAILATALAPLHIFTELRLALAVDSDFVDVIPEVCPKKAGKSINLSGEKRLN